MGRNNDDFLKSTGMQTPEVDLDAFYARNKARAKMSSEERDAQDKKEYAASSADYLKGLDSVADKFKKSGNYGQVKDFHDEHIKLASKPWPSPEALNFSDNRGILRRFNKRLGAPIGKSSFQDVSLDHRTCPFCDYVENGYKDMFDKPEVLSLMFNSIKPPK